MAKVPALYNMLTYRRPHNSKGEEEFIKDFIMPLRPEVISENNVPMAFFVYVGESNLMFTSHTDTVHAPMAATRQVVILKDGFYQKDDKQPLGADDAAGVWLLLNMINAGIPGVYAFFRGEERGGIGSGYCAKNRPDLFDGIKAAIAFDRKGTSSIITHQCRGRGCSDEFGLSLATVLDMDYKLDNTGVYTDTAEFFDIVDNCTNVSVGYYNEHSKDETLSKTHIERLRDKLLVADWSMLAHVRPTPDPIVPYEYPATRSTYLGPSKPLFEPPEGELGPTDIADILFDNAEIFPVELQEDVLALAQSIYQRFE